MTHLVKSCQHAHVKYRTYKYIEPFYCFFEWKYFILSCKDYGKKIFIKLSVSSYTLYLSQLEEECVGYLLPLIELHDRFTSGGGGSRRKLCGGSSKAIRDV